MDYKVLLSQRTMSAPKPTKRHLREVMLYFFNIKKSAAESYRLLQEAYGVDAPSNTTCKDWFKRFRNGDLDVEDKSRSGRPKQFEDDDLKALLDADPQQTRHQLAGTLGISKSVISMRLKAMRVKNKDGVWIQRKNEGNRNNVDADDVDEGNDEDIEDHGSEHDENGDGGHNDGDETMETIPMT